MSILANPTFARAMISPTPPKPFYYVGCDLGQSADYTAICVIEIRDEDKGMLLVRHLERFRELLYPEVARRVEKLVNRYPLLVNHDLIVDATGVGPAVTDIFKENATPFKGVKIHGGDHETFKDGYHRVPKRDLVQNLQVLFHSGRLKIAASLGLAQPLKDELLNFKMKVNIATAHDSYEAWREGDHDDLVLATALAAWGARKGAAGTDSLAVSGPYKPPPEGRPFSTADFGGFRL